MLKTRKCVKDWHEFILQTKFGTQFVLWEDLPKILTKRDFGRFSRWMRGQTMLGLTGGQSGVYPCDLERFLEGGDCVD